MINSHGQVTMFIIIGLVVVVIAAGLIIGLPRIIAPTAPPPPSISLQRCIDQSFAVALFNVSSRGGRCEHSFQRAQVIDTAMYPHSHNNVVCYGLVRPDPGVDGANLIYSDNTFYGHHVFSDLNTFSSRIKEATLHNIESCPMNIEYRDPVVILGDRTSDFRVQARTQGDERYSTVSSSFDVPFRIMRSIISRELTRASNSKNFGAGDGYYGLNHSFTGIFMDPGLNLAREHIPNATVNNHSIFYIRTTNNPLPLEAARQNVYLAIVIQNRFPVVNNTDSTCADVELIDPDEHERDIHAPDWHLGPCIIDPNEDADGSLFVYAGPIQKEVYLP
ncbi:MAG: hypothetical protein ACMXYL_05455 [Candidatus Woesearchaeota archaeon]